MSNAIYHNHHIVPRHAGGTDAPSNIIKLTVSEHAEAHRKLYEEYGDFRDKLAYQGLLGIVGQEEIVQRLTAVAKGSKWYYNPESPEERRMIRGKQTVPEGWVLGRGTNTWSSNRDYKNVSDEHRNNTSAASKKMWAEGKCDNRKPPTTTQAVLDGREKNRGLKRDKKQCPHCNRHVAVNTYPRWHGDNCKLIQT